MARPVPTCCVAAARRPRLRLTARRSAPSPAPAQREEYARFTAVEEEAMSEATKLLEAWETRHVRAALPVPFGHPLALSPAPAAAREEGTATCGAWLNGGAPFAACPLLCCVCCRWLQLRRQAARWRWARRGRSGDGLNGPGRTVRGPATDRALAVATNRRPSDPWCLTLLSALLPSPRSVHSGLAVQSARDWRCDPEPAHRNHALAAVAGHLHSRPWHPLLRHMARSSATPRRPLFPFLPPPRPL